MSLYTYNELMKQTSFQSYYFHWSLDDILDISHLSREQLCTQINQIHRELNHEPNNIFEL